ncbi:hypothetical protein VCHA53O466_40344 [Vibrio chagasii]|nr:hypothetical protein VCHA53O466_40344 [Vibrio chagasii]
MGKKRVCFNVSDRLARKLAAFRAVHENGANVDNYMSSQLHRFIDRINKETGVTIDLNEGDSTEVCSKCGGKMVKRKSKYGKFYGCSNHPKCKHTVDIK